MGGKDPNHTAVFGDGPGILSGGPAGSGHNLSGGVDLIVLLPVDINGGAAVVLAGCRVPAPGVSPHVFDGELFRIVEDLGKDLHHLVGQGLVDQEGAGGGALLPHGLI